MQDHFDLTDDEFFSRMESGVLRKKFFSHEAHLRLAWLHIKKYGAEEAEQSIATQIKNYVNTIGMGDKFNLTLTIVCVRMVNNYIARSGARSIHRLLEAYPELLTDFRSILSQYYSDVIYSEAAKSKFIEPDLKAIS